MFRLNISAELTVRVCIITLIFAIISYFLVQKDVATPDKLATTLPLLFATCGVVILISILYCLRIYHVWDATR